MRRRTNRHLGTTLAMALVLGVAHAKDAPGLTAADFVGVGDRVTDMLDTSGLAFSTMVMVSAATQEARPRHARFHPPTPPVDAQTFKSPCPGGGSVKASMRDAETSGDLSPDGRFVTVFESCVIEGSVVKGRSEFVVASHSGPGRGGTC